MAKFKESKSLWPKDHYYVRKVKTDLLLLHHKLGYGMRSSANWLKHLTAKNNLRGKAHIGVHYFVDRNGDRLQTIPEDGYAFHLGVGSKLGVDRRSIAIELANLGYFREVDGKLLDFYGRKVNLKKYKNYPSKPWRNHENWEAYYEKQIDSLIELCDHILVDNPDIPRVIPANFFPDNPVNRTKLAAFKGVLSHTHFRKGTEKWDVSIAFEEHYERFVKDLNLKKIRL